MKTVLITGATSGFGKGLVTEFLKNNYKVVATGRNLSQRKNIFENERRHFKDSLIEMDLDVTSKDDVQKIELYFSKNNLDILVNNAGYAVFGPAEECSEAHLRQQFEVNFFGLVFLTQKLLPSIRKTKGHIVNFSSVFGLMGFPLSSAYCASKFAVEGFSESLSYELRPFGVRVTLVEPGAYRTNFNTSAIWGMKSNISDSAYETQVKNYTQLRTKLSTRPNPQNPEDVISGVVKLVTNESTKLNYSFGRDALLTRIFKKSLPRSTFHRLTGKILNRLFLKELT